jgi:hypothetical protein
MAIEQTDIICNQIWLGIYAANAIVNMAASRPESLLFHCYPDLCDIFADLLGW